MRVTQVLHGPPIFRFWKEFGNGKDLKKRHGYFNQWQYIWNAFIRRMKIEDKTLTIDQLPVGSRILNAEDFMLGHIDAMPEDLLKIKRGERIVYDHPWPYDFQLDPYKSQERIYLYTIDTRFFNPREDIQNLTNTIIETEAMGSHPPLEPRAEHIDQIERKLEWATTGDSVLVRLPKQSEWPKINLRPKTKYGITDERAETNVLKSIASHAQTILANYQFGVDKLKFSEYLKLGNLSFPQCRVVLERESHKIGLDLCIDHMTIGREPLLVLNEHPEETISRPIADIKPRTWKSLLERTRFYSNDWSFKFPSGSCPRTIYLASRIKRNMSDEEMLAKNIIHAYGLTSQLYRMGHFELPMTLQVISYKLLPEKTFFFTRYQLNTVDFSSKKNQAWHSGPVKDIGTAFRYFLDFEDVVSTEAEKKKKIASS